MIEIMNTDDDFIAKFMNIVIAVDVSYRNFPVRGKLIQATKDYILLERANGDIGMVRRDTILGIIEARNIHEQVV
jgi:hypothetical protein